MTNDRKNMGAMSKNNLGIVDFCEINYFVVSVLVFFITKNNLLSKRS